MAGRDRDLWTESFGTVTDLSALQYYCVKLTALDTVGAIVDEQDPVLGILQNNPKANQTAAVRLLGMTKAVSDGSGTAINVGDFVGSDDTGHVVKKATADYTVIGRALDASTTLGAVIGVMMTGLSFFRVAADA